jgi:Right handed beta helix region
MFRAGTFSYRAERQTPGTILLIGYLFATAVKGTAQTDPGVRSVAAGAGGPIAGMTMQKDRRRVSPSTLLPVWLGFCIFHFLFSPFTFCAVPPVAPCDSNSLYVATSGDDNLGNGSFTSPYRTIIKGISSLPGGRTLCIRGGTYNDMPGNMAYPSGSPTSYTTIRSYPGETVIMQPPPGGGGWILFDFYDQDYISISGLTMDGQHIMAGILRDYDDIPPYDAHIRIINNTITGAIWNGIVVGAGNTEIINNNIYDNGTIDQCPNARPPGTPPCVGYGIYMGAAYTLVEGNDIHHNGRYGIHGYSQNSSGIFHDNTVRFNKIHDNEVAWAGCNLLLGGDNHLAYDNLIYGGSEGIEIGWGYGSQNIQLFNNTIQTTGSGIVIVNGSRQNTQIANNIITGTTTPIYDGGIGTTFTSNLCDTPGTGCSVVGK